MNLVYLYDGTFEGLMTCFWRIFQTGEEPLDIAAEGLREKTLFEKEKSIETDEKAAASMIDKLRRCLTQRSFRRVARAFHSGKEGREKMIYAYVKMGLEKGQDLDLFLTDDVVMAIRDMARKVGIESHRMRGFVRFRELSNGVYYARVHTDHYILPFIAPYFSQRMSDRRWIIHDAVRGKAAVYDLRSWGISDIEKTAEPELSMDEEKCQALWKNYFKNIAIRERKNPRLQRQFMPARYWQDIVEMEEETGE
jgi:probable DNA metabolism protein